MTDTPKRTVPEATRIARADKVFHTLTKAQRGVIVDMLSSEEQSPVLEGDFGSALDVISRDWRALDAEGRARLLRVLAS